MLPYTFLHTSYLAKYPPPPYFPPTPHIQAQNAHDSGDHDTARRLDGLSLIWNVGVYIFYALVTIAWIAAVIVVVTPSDVSRGGCIRTNGYFACG